MNLCVLAIKTDEFLILDESGAVVGRGKMRGNGRADLVFDELRDDVRQAIERLIPEVRTSPALSSDVDPRTLDLVGNPRPRPERRDKNCATCGERFRGGAAKCSRCGTWRDGSTRPKGKGGSQAAG